METPNDRDICRCGHEAREHVRDHEERGDCMHWSSEAEVYCECDEFRLKREAVK